MGFAWRLLSVLIAVGALVGACSDDREEFVGKTERPTTAPGASPSGESTARAKVSWTGCDISKKAYMTEAAAAYQEKTGVEIVVTGGGATRGIRSTAGGGSDIGGTCRHCLPDVSDEEEGAVMTHVAWDALVFFTHPDNPVRGISQKQAQRILTGSITNWRQLAPEWPDEKIVPAFRKQTVLGKLSGVGFMTRLLLFRDTTVEYTNDAMFHRSSGPIESFVETMRFSFAVTGVSSANKRKVRILELDGVAPTKEAIASGDYPLFRPLYLVTKGEPKGEAKKFLDWIVGPEGQKVLSDAGTVNLEEGAALRSKFKHWPQDKSLIRNY
ncbi:MAG: phosphate ABC transporter substrate-binding protein [Planctomycetota bacterium]|jgi:phosphate transport system substrate-binding protein